MPSTRPRRPLRSRLTSPMNALGDADLHGHDRLLEHRLAVHDALLERHRRGDLEREVVRVDRVEGAVVEGRLEVDERVARQHALGGGLADPLLDAREEVLRDRAADDLLGELDAAARVRLDLDPDVRRTCRARRSASCTCPRPGCGPGSSRGRGCAGVWVDDRRAELALEPLADDRDVGLAHGEEELLAGRAPLDPRAGLLLEHALEGRAHLVEVRLRLRLDRDHERRDRVDRPVQARAAAPCVESVSPVAVTVSLATAPISPGRSSPTGSWSLPCSRRSWPIRSSSRLLRVPHVGLAAQRPREDPQVGQPADERVGGRLEDADEERAVGIGRHRDRVVASSGRARSTAGSSEGAGR